ncbi:MAG: phosphatidylserine decarboxylase family protein [Syntrophobacterales bacterium]|jgi:phosphatidylserine decarboxylase|nr:phosphatidylserine decarboxylase family protein [Syntrophobacterales bacterium]
MALSSGTRRSPIAAPGYPLILAGVVLIFLGLIGHWPWLTVLGLVAGGFCAYFYRDPEREIPGAAGLIVSPADGVVVQVDEVRENEFMRGPARRVAIFMNVFDVHVNRSPLAGTVSEMKHRDGEYKAASREDAALRNEQQAVVLECEGRRVLVVQIAGLLARRIIPFVRPGQSLARGERLGMICFGSRVDLYLPLTAEIKVQVKDRLKAGSSVIGRWA